MRFGTPSGVVVYTCGGSARVGTWPHRGKLEGGLSTTPVDGRNGAHARSGQTGSKFG